MIAGKMRKEKGGGRGEGRAGTFSFSPSQSYRANQYENWQVGEEWGE